MRLRTKYTHRLPTAPGLVLDIPMFEGSGTKVLDVSGKGNHGTITDAVWTQDENGVAMSFNGTSAYINCGTNPGLNFGGATDTITIEAWIKPGGWGSGNFGAIVDKSRVKGGYELPIRNDTKMYFYAPPASYKGSNIGLTLNEWQHVGVTYTNNSGGKFYRNGVDFGNISNIGSLSATSVDVFIGSVQGEDRFFDGLIDEVRIYAVALTADQIKRRYEQTKRDYVRAS